MNSQILVLSINVLTFNSNIPPGGDAETTKGIVYLKRKSNYQLTVPQFVDHAIQL